MYKPGILEAFAVLIPLVLYHENDQNVSNTVRMLLEILDGS